MAHFHQLFHRNCDLRYVGGFLEFKKLEFRGLKGQFDVKKANFRGLIAKIGHYSPILASKTSLWAYFHGLYNSNCDIRYVGGILVLRKLDFRGLEGQFDDNKKVNS